MDKIDRDNKVKAHYNRFLMMRDRINGATVKEIAVTWGVTASTAGRYINGVASDCMREAMTQTQGDPDHPSTPRFTIEEFTTDPRAAMVAIMEDHIRALETKCPGVKE
jgi:hypothetical protein